MLPECAGEQARGVPPADIGMTPEQRFLCDIAMHCGQACTQQYSVHGTRIVQLLVALSDPVNLLRDRLDMNGYLHLKGVLQGEQLETARSAAVRYAHDDPGTLNINYYRHDVL